MDFKTLKIPAELYDELDEIKKNEVRSNSATYADAIRFLKAEADY